jgi:hypothetical protein
LTQVKFIENKRSEITRDFIGKISCNYSNDDNEDKTDVDLLLDLEALSLPDLNLNLSFFDNICDMEMSTGTNETSAEQKTRRLWSKDETLFLLHGVHRFGRSQWQKIHKHCKSRFDNRSVASLQPRHNNFVNNRSEYNHFRKLVVKHSDRLEKLLTNNESRGSVYSELTKRF